MQSLQRKNKERSSRMKDFPKALLRRVQYIKYEFFGEEFILFA